MAYCTLDSNGNITGIFNMPQPQMQGYAVIDDADPRIAVFNTPPAPVPDLATQRAAALIANGTLQSTDLQPATLAQANITLTAARMTTISATIQPPVNTSAIPAT
jgi:hypothetical protein